MEVVLTISKSLRQKTCRCGLQLYLKRDFVTGVLNVVELLRTPFLIEHLRWLLLVFSFQQIFPSFYIKMTGL